MIYQRLHSLLLRYLSPSTAETVLRRALHEAGVTNSQLAQEHLSKVVPHVERGIRLFVPTDRQHQLTTELSMLVRGGMATPSPQLLPVKVENDIGEARMVARGICAQMGARSVTVQKVATIVSELARNIVSYTTGGTIELVVMSTSPAKLKIKAQDTGRGIKNLDEIFAGNYKSKTGLGKGLLGVKRLADTFEIQSGETGTKIEVAVAL
jgi:serine/threonine-protein kinase RsbT